MRGQGALEGKLAPIEPRTRHAATARPSCASCREMCEGPLGNDGTLLGPMNKAPHPLVNRPRTVVNRARLETRYFRQPPFWPAVPVHVQLSTLRGLLGLNGGWRK
jgi:hypothetical protein